MSISLGKTRPNVLFLDMPRWFGMCSKLRCRIAAISMARVHCGTATVLDLCRRSLTVYTCSATGRRNSNDFPHSAQNRRTARGLPVGKWRTTKESVQPNKMMYFFVIPEKYYALAFRSSLRHFRSLCSEEMRRVKAFKRRVETRRALPAGITELSSTNIILNAS